MYVSQNKMVFQKSTDSGNKKIEVITNKSVYVGLSVLDFSKAAMYEYWYEYANQNRETRQNCATWI